MSREKFDDNCPGCRPVILDRKTGRPMPEDDLVVQKMMAVWAGTTYAQREAFHNVMCLNSRDPTDLVLVKMIVDQLK